MHARRPCVALVVLAAASCGPGHRYSVDPRELLAVNQEQAAARVAAAREIAEALERDTCDAVRRIDQVATSNDPRFGTALGNDPQLGTALGELRTMAAAFCDAGVQSVGATTDEFGSPAIRQPEGGVISSGIEHFVFAGAESAELGLVASTGETSGTAPCFPYGDDEADAIVHILGDSALTVFVDDAAASIAAVGADGTTVCGSGTATPGSMTLSPRGGPWEIYVGSDNGEQYRAALGLSRSIADVDGFRWEIGSQESFSYSIGPYTDSAGTISSSCYGHISAEPLMRFSSAFEGYGYIEVSGDGDSVMVVRDAAGQVWCNDDSVGLNPALDLYVGIGTYELWVGTYSIGTTMDVTVTFY